jgi:hypothetical protein
MAIRCEEGVERDQEREKANLGHAQFIAMTKHELAPSSMAIKLASPSPTGDERMIYRQSIHHGMTGERGVSGRVGETVLQTQTGAAGR